MDWNELSDEELAASLKQAKTAGEKMREKHIASVLFDRFYRQVYSLSRYYGLRHNDAEDSVQESFIRLFKSIEHYQADRPFKPWFFKIVLNLVRKKYKELKKRKHQDLDDYEESPEAKENIFEKFHNREQVRDIVHRLPEKLKKVAVLWIFQELGFEEIAELLGIGSRQVRNRLDQACGLIKEKLEEGT